MGMVSWLRTRVRATDRLMLASGLVAVVAIAWFAVNLWRPTGPAVLLWWPVPVGGALAVAIFWRTSRTASLPVPVRRFWRLLTVVAALTTLSMSYQAVDALARPELPGRHITMPMHILDAAAVLV